MSEKISHLSNIHTDCQIGWQKHNVQRPPDKISQVWADAVHLQANGFETNVLLDVWWTQLGYDSFGSAKFSKHKIILDQARPFGLQHHWTEKKKTAAQS